MRRMILTGLCIAMAHFILVLCMTSYAVNTLDERVYSPYEPHPTPLAIMTATFLAQPSGILWRPLGLGRLPAAIPVLTDSVVWALVIIGVLEAFKRFQGKKVANNVPEDIVANAPNPQH